MDGIMFAENLAVGYDGKPVAENINFVVYSGDYFCIVGENGAGKSTLLKTLLGFIPKINGTFEKMLGEDDIGYLPQQADFQRDFPATVEEIVLSGRLGHKHKFIYDKQDKEYARLWMEKLHVDDLAGKSYRKLSGGQQQRVLLARTLVRPRRVIILDEPVTGLDVVSRKEMYDIIYDLNRHGMTIVMITHDDDAILKYSSHVLMIKHDGCEFKEVRR